MRHTVTLWAVAILLPALHFLLHVGLGIGSVAPDLLTVGVLVTARQVSPPVAAGVGFFLGLVADALSLLSFGTNAAALTVVGFLGSRSRDFFMGESFLFLASYLALGTWLREAIHWIIAGGGLWAEAPRVLLVEAPVSALYAAAVGTVVLAVTGAWESEGGR